MQTRPDIRKILFATDLSKTAEHAFAHAGGMAEAYDAKVTVLHVMEELPPNAEILVASLLGLRNREELRQKSEADLVDRIREHIRQFCAEITDRMPECSLVPEDIIVEPGDAADRILHHAGEGGYDALVIGTHGHGVVRRAVLGGTSLKVVTNCPIPMFVIPVAESGL